MSNLSPLMRQALLLALREDDDALSSFYLYTLKALHRRGLAQPAGDSRGTWVLTPEGHKAAEGLR